MDSLDEVGYKEYKEPFSNLDSETKKELFKTALATRNFEIDLYWKRTTYYWTINAAIFAAYFFLLNKSQSKDSIPIITTFAVNSLGLIFSLAWYLTNKASKFWQINWEKHIEALEDDIIGPLFKTTLRYKDYATFKRFITPSQAYPFSVSKINSLLSLFVFCLWAIFWVSFAWHSFSISPSEIFSVNTFIFFSTIITLISFLILGQTGINIWPISKRHTKTKMNFQRRGLEEK